MRAHPSLNATPVHYDEEPEDHEKLPPIPQQLMEINPHQVINRCPKRLNITIKHLSAQSVAGSSANKQDGHCQEKCPQPTTPHTQNPQYQHIWFAGDHSWHLAITL